MCAQKRGKWTCGSRLLCLAQVVGLGATGAWLRINWHLLDPSALDWPPFRAQAELPEPDEPVIQEQEEETLPPKDSGKQAPKALEPREQAAVPLEDPKGRKVELGACPKRVKRRKEWDKVVGEDTKIMDAAPPASAVLSCKQQGHALIFTLDLRKVQSVGGFAYEVSLPDYLVADETEAGWREKRSSLQLFYTGPENHTPKPLGPAHSSWKHIEKVGNGAFQHWRNPVTAGPDVHWSSLRFSTKRNEPLSRLTGLLAVVHPMAPPMGWVEFVYKFDKTAKSYDASKRRRRQQVFRELFLRSFPTVGAEPQLVQSPEETTGGTWYLWRMSHHDEFDVALAPGQIYPKEMPKAFARFFQAYERQGAKLFPPPSTYVYYENKVGLARLFEQKNVKTPKTWVFQSLEEALRQQENIRFPVVIKDPYGYSSLGLLQASGKEEYKTVIREFFAKAKGGVEALVQSKVVALREARVTYIDGRPWHGYWRIRQSLESASAASTRGGYQDFSFPLADIAPHVARFANATGIPVGGVDFIWQEAKPDVRSEPFTLEVSPTSDVNPPTPKAWALGYAAFKKTPGFRAAYLKVRRQWADTMVLAVVDRYRLSKRHLFVDIDNVVARSVPRIKRNRGAPKAYLASEVLKDEAVPDAARVLQSLRAGHFVRFLTARGQYEDAFNTTQRWLWEHGFSYDDLIVVDKAKDKTAHLTKESLLVDDFTNGHEKEVPQQNTKFMQELRKAGLPFVLFPLGGLWKDVLPQILAWRAT